MTQISHTEKPLREQTRADQLATLLACVQNITFPLAYHYNTAVNEHVELAEPWRTMSNPNGIGELRSFENLQQTIYRPLPTEGQGQEGFQDAVSFLSRHSVNTSSYGFMDKLYSAPSPPGIAADLFLSILNNNNHVWHVSPALSTVEKHVGVQLAQRFGLCGEHAGGITVPGGAAGNMLAMLVARNIVAPETKTKGFSLGKRYAIFTSEEAHYSIANAAQILGLGSDAVVCIPTTPEGSMDVAELENAVNEGISRDIRPLFIVATAGTTVRGAVDPLRDIARIARKANAWFHVDACWGGAFIFSDTLGQRLAGTELADSLSFNPHKLLGVPLICSFLLARDMRTFWVANKLEAGYLFHGAENQAEAPAPTALKLNGVHASNGHRNGTEGSEQSYPDWRDSAVLSKAPPASQIKDLASFTTQCGRRPDASKFYLHWIYYGTKGMAAEVERAAESARYLAGLVEKSPYLTLVGNPDVPLTQVCFYWTPERGAASIGPEECAVASSQKTRDISRQLVTRGWMIDYAPGSARHGQYGDFIRAVCNRLTDKNVVDALFKDLIHVGLERNVLTD